MAITFRQLEVFRAVATTKSFTRAGHLLFVSQSTVSQHIRELEEALSVPLFSRTRRDVAITQAGENLLEYAERIFRMLEEAESNAKTIADPYCGRLRFGCASTTLLYHLPGILQEYIHKYPNVEFEILGGTIQEIASRLWAETLDLALVVLPFSAPELKMVPLFKEPFVMVLPADHPLSRRRHLEIEDLANERFVLNRQDQNTRKLIDRFLFQKKISPRVAVELAEAEAIKAMVTRGIGVSILPASALTHARKKGGLKTFPIQGHDLRRSLALVHRRRRPLRPAAAALIELLQKQLARPPAFMEE